MGDNGILIYVDAYQMKCAGKPPASESAHALWKKMKTKGCIKSIQVTHVARAAAYIEPTSGRCYCAM